MGRDDDWDDDEDDRPRRRKKRARYEDDEDDDDYDRPRRRGSAAEKSGAVTAVGIINIVLGSLVTLASLCVLLGGALFAGAAAEVNQMGNPGAGIFAMGSMIVIILGLVIMLFGSGLIVAGIGVLNRRNWGRILTFILAGLVVVSAVFVVIGLVNTFNLPPGFPGKAASIIWSLVILALEIAYVVLVFTILPSSRSAAEFR